MIAYNVIYYVRCDQIDHYQKVSRNARGLSEVRKMNVANLEQES